MGMFRFVDMTDNEYMNPNPKKENVMREVKPMTVGELINKLKGFDPNMLVRIECPDDYKYYYPVAEDIGTDDNDEEVVFYGIFSVK